MKFKLFPFSLNPLGFSLLFISSVSSGVPFEGHHMVAAGPSPIVAEITEAIAAEGGNVVDAAVAIGLGLSVTSPYYAGLGGGGFALIKMGPKVEVLDFREVAPLGTGPEYYPQLENPKASVFGGTAVAVPGFPAGLWALHQKYGKLKWAKLFRIPLRMAKRGFRVSGEWTHKTNRMKKHFSKGGLKHFFKRNGKSYLPGEVLKQPALQKALLQFQAKGDTGFYRGSVAKDLVSSVKAAGGALSLKDLESYQVKWRKPLQLDLKGYRFHLMPPPSSGGLLIHMGLRAIDQLNLNKYAQFGADEYHMLGEILSRVFRHRGRLGDPDFEKLPVEELLSKKILSDIKSSIHLKKSKKLKPIDTFKNTESTETTHYSVLDHKGRSVSLTVTLNGNYGSGVVSRRFGVALNNEMDDFTTIPNQPNIYGLIQGQANLVKPGKRPLSSMSPTLVEKDGKIILSLGSPGGPRIISGVLQVLYRNLFRDLDIDQAIQAPRLHHQFLPHELYIDRKRFGPEEKMSLKKRGHNLTESWMGKVYGVRLTDKGLLKGAFDSRGEGGAGGY